MNISILLVLVLFITAYIIIDRLNDRHSARCLWNAIETGDAITLRSILRSNPHLIYRRNSDGLTPLQKAMFRGNTECARYLVCRGAELHVRSSVGASLLHLAAQYGDDKMVRLFADIATNLDICDSFAATPLHYAVRSGRAGNVHVIAEKGASLDKRDSDGRTPLYLAISQGFNKTADLLIHSGADIAVQDSDGNTLLILAVQKGAINVALTLIKNGASLDSIGSEGLTALHIACEQGYSDVIECLLKKGANMNAQSIKRNYPTSINRSDELCNVTSSYGLTPLHIAVKYRFDEVVITLVRNGAKENIRDSSGRTPYEMALKSGNRRAMWILGHEKWSGAADCSFVATK
ncbi:MAG: ankyrin repeat domain-containing protein [Candidatus Xenobiia bacterium LiM19]